MSVAFRYAARSNIGLGRYKNNQDSGFAGPHILAVCDGVGGHAGGDIASSIAVAHLATLDGESLGSDAPRILVSTIRESHAAMLERVEAEPQLAGMGTTVTALLKYGDKLALAHCGDSRAYCLHDGSMTQITKDHTFVQWLIDQGTITPEEAEVHPQRSVITRVLGDAGACDDIDTSVRQARIGDRWLLCSDGLSGPVSDETLARTLEDVQDPGECAEKLIDLALKAGGQDNITCVIADVVSADTDGTRAPIAVGAASVETSNKADDSTPATRAAQLIAPTVVPEAAGPDAAPSGSRKRLISVAVVGAVVAALVGATWMGYRWSQQQYFVGAYEDNVAIFTGLSDDLGPITLSSLQEETQIPLEALQDVPRGQVQAGISVADLDAARQTVRSILQQSRLCVAVNQDDSQDSAQTPQASAPTLPAPPPPTLPAPPPPGSNGAESDQVNESEENAEAPATLLTEAPILPSASATQTPSTDDVRATQTPLNYLGEPLPKECESS